MRISRHALTERPSVFRVTTRVIRKILGIAHTYSLVSISMPCGRRKGCFFARLCIKNVPDFLPRKGEIVFSCE